MNLFKDIKDIDFSIRRLMKNGFNISLLLSIFSSYILFLYTYNPISHIWFDTGILLLKTSITLFVAFFVCGFSFDKIKKGL